MNRRLSIIIPVYNVEPYVGKTLESVFDTMASADEFEVIVVNDGTKDGSMDVVRQFTDRPNLIIIEQENQGLSAARMKGLSVATGDYVWFVDSDDWLVENGVGKVLGLLDERPGAEVLMFPILRLSLDSEEKRIDPIFLEEQCLSGKDYQIKGYTPTPASRFVFKRELIENKWLFFPPGLLHEDLYWGTVLLYLSKSIIILTQPVYVYRLRSGSIMTTIGIRSSYDLVSVHRLLMDYMRNGVASEDWELFRRYCFRPLRWSYTINAKQYGTKEFRRFVRINGLYVWREWNKSIPDVPWKRKVKRLLFCKMPGWFTHFIGNPPS